MCTAVFLVMPSSIRDCTVAFSRKLGSCFVGHRWSTGFDRLIVEKLCPTLTSAGASTRSGWRAGPISLPKMLCCCLSGSSALYVRAFLLELLLASCAKIASSSYSSQEGLDWVSFTILGLCSLRPQARPSHTGTAGPGQCVTVRLGLAACSRKLLGIMPVNSSHP